MAYKYIYIDDTRDAIEQGTINALQDGKEIEITFKSPNDWEAQMIDLKNILPNFQGIILDLRLNDIPYEVNKYAQYRGSTVAQELRTLAKENKFQNDFPIILISADNNLHKSLDPTSLDLFDFCVSKNRLEQTNGISYLAFRNELKWLADGYSILNKLEKSIQTILNIENSNFIDIRFVDEFNNLMDKPVHIIARFLNKEVIKKKTFLIDESYLAARLGIDIIGSKDWKSFIEKYLTDSLYKGAFSNYHSRWWMNGIETFWEKTISEEYNLRNLSATKRVEFIIKKTGFKNLTPIKKQPKSKSDSFWVICKATGVAIDTIDGFIVANQDHLFPWQEKEYVCIDEALRPKRIDLWKGVSSLEKNRLQLLKDYFDENETRARK